MRRFGKRLSLFAALWPCVCLLGCRTPESRLSRYSREGRCEQAAELLGTVKHRAQISENLKVAGRDLASYSLIGLGGSADIVLVYGSGFVLSGAVCSPALLIDIPLAKATDGKNESIWGDCTSELASELLHDVRFPIGTATRDATARWRERNSDPISKSMRLVAECYLQSGDAHDLEKASKQLEIVKNGCYENLSPDERGHVAELEARILRLQQAPQSK